MLAQSLALLSVVVASQANMMQRPPVDSLERDHIRGPDGVRLDSLLRSYAANGFSGTVLVVRDRRIVLLKGYGLANVERGVRNSPATRFEMNSMTKMFTAVGLLQLAQAGRIRLDAPLELYVGQLPAEKRGTTVAQLAMHTSGMVVAGTNLATETRDAFVADMKRTPREAPPGTQYRYTNAGYSMLAALIEITSGIGYEDYLRKNIFAPAGMRSARFRTEVPENDTLFAVGYVGGPSGRQRGPPNPYGWGTRGAGGVWTTVGDIYRWVVAVQDSVVVNGAMRQMLFTPPQPPSEEAFGWHVRPATDSTRLLVDKGGGSPDFASQMLHFPSERTVIVWASNDLTRRWRQTLNRAIPEVLFGGSTTAQPPR